MLDRIARTAHEADQWLHQNAGRTYAAILGWGLVLSILGSLGILLHALSQGKDGLTILVVLVIQAALLVNQLAQWHEWQERRRRRKDAARAMKPSNSVAEPE